MKVTRRQNSLRYVDPESSRREPKNMYRHDTTVDQEAISKLFADIISIENWRINCLAFEIG